MDPPPSKPKINSSTVILTGLTVYLLAILWPPTILIITFVLSKIIPYFFRVNEYGDWRRALWKPWSLEEERPDEWQPENLSKVMNLKEKYWQNQRGMVLMTSTMIPKNVEVKAVVCLCHGFNDQSSYYKRIDYQRLIREGIAIVTIEYEGHGRSDGLLSYISSWENLIDDTSQFFQETIEKKFPGKKCFLMGESMGGAISYYTYQRNPKLWSGIVFVAPMLKVSDEILPPPWVVKLFQALVGNPGSYSRIGWLPIAPSANITRKAFKLSEKRLAICNFPCFYGRQPRLATAREILNVTLYIEENYKDFDAPFIIIHGKNDMVTCPDLSEIFYNGSKSKDKDIKIYDDSWHQLTHGEAKEDIDKLFNDVNQWISARC